MAKGDRGRRGRQEYGRTERERGHERRDKEQRAQERRDKEAAKKEEPGIVDRTVGAVKDFFTGREDTAGFSPIGGPSSYGMSKKEFDTTIGERRHAARSLDERLAREVDYFQEAPLDYVSDILDNPLVAGGVLATGLAAPAFGVKVLDAALDISQLEANVPEALSNVAYGALNYTGVGAAVPGEVKAVAKAGLKKGIKGIAEGTSSVVGGKVGVGVGSQLAEAFTDNPYARAGITAASAATASWGATQAARTALAQPRPNPTTGSTPTPSRASERSVSPLVSSGEAAIASSRDLVAQTGPTDLYSQTVRSIPYYGLSPELTGRQQQPYYGV